jgi:chromosome segregation ATPase
MEKMESEFLKNVADLTEKSSCMSALVDDLNKSRDEIKKLSSKAKEYASRNAQLQKEVAIEKQLNKNLLSRTEIMSNENTSLQAEVERLKEDLRDLMFHFKTLEATKERGDLKDGQVMTARPKKSK